MKQQSRLQLLATLIITSFQAYGFLGVSQLFDRNSSSSSKSTNRQSCDKMLIHRPGQHLRIVNPLGTVTVVADANADQISIHAVKYAKDQEALETIQFECCQNSKGPLVRACKASKTTKGTTDVTAIVPLYTPVQIIASGPVTISDTYGPLHVLTHGSPVEITNPRNVTRVKTTGKGAVTIVNAKDHVKVQTERAPITITDSHKSILASCEAGTITLSPHMLPNLARINATVTGRGNINLALPQSLEAAMSAYTQEGTVTCELPITVDPFTTTLDKQAWETFKRKVEGYRRSAVASISTQTKKGNVKIVEQATPKQA